MARSESQEVSTDDLRLLLLLTRTGRMTAVGAVLGIDHTTVRRRLRRLENALGSTLIVHGSNGWSLTDFGRAVAEQASPLEQVVQRVSEVTVGKARGLRETVRITAPDGFGSRLVTAAVADVMRQHPGISVDLVTSTRPLRAKGAGFDMSVYIGQPVACRLASERIARYALGLYAADDYLTAHAPISSVEDLRSHRLVFYVDALLTVDELDLTRHFSPAKIGFACTNVHAQVEATRLGAGIGLLPCFLAEGESTLRRVLPDQVRFVVDMSLSVQRRSMSSPAVQLIRQALLAQIEKRQVELLPAH